MSDYLPDEAIEASLDTWMARANLGLTATPRDHIKFLLIAALPKLHAHWLADFERQLYEAHERGWREGVAVTQRRHAEDKE